MKKAVLLALVLAILILSACISGSGNIVTENREVGSFRHIAMGGSGEIFITQGNAETLIVEADDNLLPYIRTTVRGNTLELGLNAPVFTPIWASQSIRYIITVRDLESVRISGSGNANIASIASERFSIQVSGSGEVNIARLVANSVETRVSGSGNIAIAGQVDEQSVEISGSGEYRAADLASNRASVRVSGSGDATVWALSELTANISGSGNVNYYGNPTTNTSTSGSGTIRGLGSR
jgi:carbon monoxide dehydrogenase subunit G